jgi:hypothetical protein
MMAYVISEKIRLDVAVCFVVQHEFEHARLVEYYVVWTTLSCTDVLNETTTCRNVGNSISIDAV